MSTTIPQFKYMKQSECLARCIKLFGTNRIRLTTIGGREAIQLRSEKNFRQYNTIAKGIGWADAFQQAMIQAQKIIEEGHKQKWFEEMKLLHTLNKYELGFFEEVHLQGSIQKNLIEQEINNHPKAVEIKQQLHEAVDSLLKLNLIKLDEDNNYTLNVPPLKQ